MGTLATRLVLLPPKDPESKGVVERRNGWFETSFMPGRHFASPADFNAQFTDWLARANARVVRTIKAARSTCSMPTGPRCWRCRRSRCTWAGATKIRLGRDYYVRVDTNDYSVDPRAIGRPRGRGRRPAPCPGPTRRAARGRAPATLGPGHDRHRPRARHQPPPSCEAPTSTRAPAEGAGPGARPDRLRPAFGIDAEQLRPR